MNATPDAQAVLSLDNIGKFYGSIEALQNVSLSVPAGSVFGILGPNGSGKTTLLGIVMDILKPTSGSFELFGSPPTADMRKNIGTLLETPNFYPYLSGERNLVIAAEIKGKGRSDIASVLDKVNLTERKASKFSTYSLGMKQRLSIASALLGNPTMLVLDEPTNGLDPVGIAEIRELIRQLANEGKTIIMASHLLDEVEKVCTHVAIMKRGRLLAAGRVDDILVNEDLVEISGSDLSRIELIAQTLAGSNYYKRYADCIQISFPAGTANPGMINQYYFDNGITLQHLVIKRKSLEAKFFELTNS